MDPVDYTEAKYAALVTKAIDLLQWPHHCRFTGRATEDLVKLKLSRGEVLDSMRVHLKAKLPLYSELQTMSELEPVMGYIFCPLVIQGKDLRIFCKFILPDVALERDEKIWVKSCHEPTFPCPGEKKL